MAKLLSVQVGRPRERCEGDVWVSAIFKDVVAGAIHLDSANLAGDEQADRRVHGGPDKAVCVYSADHFPFWRTTLGRDDVGPGAFGENFTVAGTREADVCIGDVFEVGTAVVQVSQPRGPCWKLGRKWSRLDLPKVVISEGKTGWYLRVLQAGDVEAGQEIALVDRPYPEYAITEANRLAYAKADGALIEARRRFSGCPALSAAWRASMAEA